MSILQQLYTKTPRLFYEPDWKLSNLCVDIEEIVNRIKISKDSVIVDVGCFAGVTTHAFALNYRRVYAVAEWKQCDEFPNGLHLQELEARFHKMHSENGNVEFIRYDLQKAPELFRDQSVDLVYLESEHEHSYVTALIKAWLPKIKPGGYIAGHGLEISDVKRAADDLFGTAYENISYLAYLYRVPGDYSEIGLDYVMHREKPTPTQTPTPIPEPTATPTIQPTKFAPKPKTTTFVTINKK